MMTSIGIESIATSAPAVVQRTLAMPSAAPQRAESPAAEAPARPVDLRSDSPPFKLRISAAAQRTRAVAPGPVMSPEEKAYLEALKARDREVREHEQAHANAGGIYAGIPEYDYVTGPDGRPYAIGGEVDIDVSPVPEDPEATIEKMIVVKEAALAPREPSTTDRQVAAKADSQRRDAEGDLRTAGAEDAAMGPSGEASPQSAGKPSLTAQPFGEAAATYRDVTAFIAMSVDSANRTVLA